MGLQVSVGPVPGSSRVGTATNGRRSTDPHPGTQGRPSLCRIPCIGSSGGAGQAPTRSHRIRDTSRGRRTRSRVVSVGAREDSALPVPLFRARMFTESIAQRDQPRAPSSWRPGGEASPTPWPSTSSRRRWTVAPEGPDEADGSHVHREVATNTIAASTSPCRRPPLPLRTCWRPRHHPLEQLPPAHPAPATQGSPFRQARDGLLDRKAWNVLTQRLEPLCELSCCCVDIVALRADLSMGDISRDLVQKVNVPPVAERSVALEKPSCRVVSPIPAPGRVRAESTRLADATLALGVRSGELGDGRHAPSWCLNE
ncbi:hypothetical protein FB157_14525 [Streptomyces sp. BK340]|nr:hypothetical protein FB157_14525 [Streptomyces sp. BK340]